METLNPNKALWEKGDFTQIAQTMRQSGEELVARLGITAGMKALDLGCGDGTTAIPEAQRGAEVLGVDIASSLVAAGNKRAAAAGLAYTPPPPEGFISPMTWGIESNVVERFGQAGISKERIGAVLRLGYWSSGSPLFWRGAGGEVPPPRHVHQPEYRCKCKQDTFTFVAPYSPAEYMGLFKNFYGPTMNAFEAAEKNGKSADLQQELTELFNRQSKAASPDSTTITATYLRVTVNC